MHIDVFRNNALIQLISHVFLLAVLGIDPEYAFGLSQKRNGWVKKPNKTWELRDESVIIYNQIYAVNNHKQFKVNYF